MYVRETEISLTWNSAVTVCRHLQAHYYISEACRNTYSFSIPYSHSGGECRCTYRKMLVTHHRVSTLQHVMSANFIRMLSICEIHLLLYLSFKACKAPTLEFLQSRRSLGFRRHSWLKRPCRTLGHNYSHRKHSKLVDHFNKNRPVNHPKNPWTPFWKKKKRA